MNDLSPIPLKNVLLVFMMLVSGSVMSHQSGLDEWLAQHVYIFERGNGHGGFPWQGNYWLTKIMHEDGRKLVKRLFFLCLGFFIASFPLKKLRPYRLASFYVLLVTLLTTGLISFLKHHSTLQCPGALAEFGGSHQMVNFWQMFSTELPQGNCFPAGHASGGYAWLCLAFVFPYGSKKFYWALLPGALLGVLFGVAQQLRGEHFLSHDLMTIALSWLIAGGVAYGVQRLLRVMTHNNWITIGLGSKVLPRTATDCESADSVGPA